MGKASQKRRLIENYIQVASKVFPQHFRKDRCLNSSRVTIDVMTYFGLDCKPLVTYCSASNRAMIKLFEKYEKPTVEQRDEAGAWMVAVGGEVEGTPGYPAHLVTLAEGSLLDSSSGQLSRPLKNLPVSEMIFAPTPKGFSDGKVPLILTGRAGVIIVYQAHPDDKSYLFAPGFQDSPWNREVAEMIIGLMK